MPKDRKKIVNAEAPPKKVTKGGDSKANLEAPRSSEHTVRISCGSGVRCAVDHHNCKATQYEFYIPALIGNLPPVKRFLSRLSSVEAGATVFPNLEGVWNSEKESTHIFRMIVRWNKLTPDGARNAIQNEIGALMTDLGSTLEFAQEAFMFTETSVMVSMTDNVRAAHP